MKRNETKRVKFTWECCTDVAQTGKTVSVAQDFEVHYLHNNNYQLHVLIKARSNALLLFTVNWDGNWDPSIFIKEVKQEVKENTLQSRQAGMLRAHVVDITTIKQ